MPARRSVRKRARDAIMVINAMTGETLGRIGNLSVDGMMLITPQPLPEGRLYQLQFMLASAERHPRRLEIGIQCMWSDAARTDRTYWTGCRIIDIAPAERDILADWVERAAERV